jgi:hypothetical protein
METQVMLIIFFFAFIVVLPAFFVICGGKSINPSDMKKIIFALLFLFSSVVLHAQSLEINEVDEFTGNTVKRTSWETFNSNTSFYGHFRISQINDSYFFDLKMMIGNKVFAIDQGQEFMFKLSDDEVISLQNLKYSIACIGCGAKGFAGSQGYGVQTSYPIDKNQIQALKSNQIVKVRIYTSEGFFENDVKAKHASKIHNALLLFE